MGGARAACAEGLRPLSLGSIPGTHLGALRRKEAVVPVGSHLWGNSVPSLNKLRRGLQYDVHTSRGNWKSLPVLRALRHRYAHGDPARFRSELPNYSHFQWREALSSECGPSLTPILTDPFGQQVKSDRTAAIPAIRQRRRQLVRCEAAPKIANLTASRAMTVPLPVHSDSEGRPRTLSEFLKLPAGRESMLKGQSCKRREVIGDNTFRCYLRSIEAFKFSVAPVIDVRVTSTDDTCTVEMLDCRFLGSEAVERQNERFSATFRNHIDWRGNGESLESGEFVDTWGERENGERTGNSEGNGAAQQMLRNEIKLDLALEVFSPPFTMLPLAAVERPGSTFLQALLDRVAPAFVTSLLADYEAWATGEIETTDVLHEETETKGKR